MLSSNKRLSVTASNQKKKPGADKTATVKESLSKRETDPVKPGPRIKTKKIAAGPELYRQSVQRYSRYLQHLCPFFAPSLTAEDMRQAKYNQLQPQPILAALLLHLVKAKSLQDASNFLKSHHFSQEISGRFTTSSRALLLAIVFWNTKETLRNQHNSVSFKDRNGLLTSPVFSCTTCSSVDTSASRSNVLNPPQHRLTTHQRALLIRQIVQRQTGLQRLNIHLEQFASYFHPCRASDFLPCLQLDLESEPATGFSANLKVNDAHPSFAELYLRYQMKNIGKIENFMQHEVMCIQKGLDELQLFQAFYTWAVGFSKIIYACYEFSQISVLDEDGVAKASSDNIYQKNLIVRRILKLRSSIQSMLNEAVMACPNYPHPVQDPRKD